MRKQYQTSLKLLLQPKTLFIFSLLLHQAFSQLEGTVAIDESFVQIKNFTNLIVQPEEQIWLKLDEYFRGNFLRYSLYLKTLEDEPQFIMDPSLVVLTPPVIEVASEDFPQTDLQMSLPQTSLIYTDKLRDNKQYFIFIDFSMQLYIYDISQYATYDPTQQNTIPQVSITNLYSALYINLTSKICNNLIQIDQDKLMMNCLGKDNSFKGGNVVNVFLDISDKFNVQARYFSSSVNFQSMKDGQYVVLKESTNFFYLIISKENKTACYFDIQRMDGYTEATVVRRIAFFHELPLTPEQDIQYQTDLIPDISDCQQQNPQDILQKDTRTEISFLQIQDVAVIPYFDNVVLATDYNYGLMFLDIYCPNHTYCSYMPIQIIKFKSLSKISIMREEGLIGEKIIFVQRINPPTVFEIKCESKEKAAVRRIFSVAGDINDYVSINIVDGNQDYIITELFSSKLMKPVIRIYKRTDSYLSIGHTQYTFTDFFDQGTAISFISVSDNFFLVKTSDYFSIFKLGSQNLIVNATNYEYMQKKKYLGKTIEVYLAVIDNFNTQLDAKLHITFVDQSNAKSSLLKYQGEYRNQIYEYFYNCGEEALLINIDNLFQGSKENNLTLKDLNQGQLSGLFEPSQFVFKQLSSILLNQTGCKLRAIVGYGTKQDTIKLLYCMDYNGNTPYYIDIINSDLNEPKIIQKLLIKSANIIGFTHDIQRQQLIIQSNSTSIGNTGAVLHSLMYYNLLSWEDSIDLNQRYPQLNGIFLFRQHQPMNYLKSIDMGTIISDPMLTQKTITQTILVYDLSKKFVDADFVLRAILNLTLPIETPQVILQNTKMDRFGNVWVILSNQTLNLYFLQHNEIIHQSDTSNKLVLKNQFYFNQYQDLANLELKDLLTFYETQQTDLQVLFFGNNKMLLARNVRGKDFLDRLMMIPLYYGNLDSDFLSGVEYEYLQNTFSGEIVYTRYNENLIFVIFKRIQKGKLIGYSLFGFDIKQTRQSILIAKQQLQPDITLDTDNVRLEIVQNETKPNILNIYFFTNETYLMRYSLKYIHELEITNSDRAILMQQCSIQNIELNYEVSPVWDPDQVAKIKITTVNTGLAITNLINRDTLTVSQIDKTSNRNNRQRNNTNEGLKKRGGFAEDALLEKDSQQLAKYSLLRVFEGQNMQFNISCTDEQDQNCNRYATIKSQSLNYSREIEVLGSSVTLLNFFFIDPGFLFFDTNYLHVYFPDLEYFESVTLTNFIGHDALPVRYFLKQLSLQNEQETNFILYQNRNSQFGISLAYSTSSYNNSDLIKQSSNFIPIQETLYIQKFNPQILIPQAIDEVEIYPLYKDNEKQAVRLILVLSDTSLLLHSLIKFLDLEQIGGSDQFYTNVKYSEKVLSADNLNIDYFNVDSISLIGKTNLLAIGVSDYGIIVYDILAFKIAKLISIKEQYRVSGIDQFYINSMVTQIEQKALHIIINNNAIYRITIDDDDNQKFKLENLYMENKIPRSSDREIARGSMGYVFQQGTREEDDPNNEIFLKFFSFFLSSKNKGIGEIKLELNEECKFLQSLPYQITKRNFFPTLSEDSMIVVAICGSTMKIKTFDYNPNIVVNTSINDQINVSQSLKISSSNYYSSIGGEYKSEIILDLTILNQEPSMNSFIYLFYILMPIIVIWLIRIVTREGKQKDDEKSQKQKKKEHKQSGVYQTTTTNGRGSGETTFTTLNKFNSIISFDTSSFIKEEENENKVRLI